MAKKKDNFDGLKKHESDYLQSIELDLPNIPAADLDLVMQLRKRGNNYIEIAKIMGFDRKDSAAIVKRIDDWERDKPFKDHDEHEFLINEITLEVPNKQDYGELICAGDLHYDGDEENYDGNKFWGWMDYCKKKNAKVLLMGDMIDCNLRGSPGAGVFTQKLSPQRQMMELVNRLYTYRKNIIGIHYSNHEYRVFKETSFNPIDYMVKALETKCLGYSAYTKVNIGKQSYMIYSYHGASGSSTLAGKVNALKRSTAFVHDVDFKVMAHVHDLYASPETIHIPSHDGKSIIEKKVYNVLTGHFLKWKGSYAEMKMLQPGRIGCPRLIFYKNNHHFHALT